MIRIAMIPHLSELSGSGIALVEKAALLDRVRFEPILVFPDSGELYDYAIERGLAPVIVANKQHSTLAGRNPFAWFRAFKERQAYIRELQDFFVQQRIDLVFINTTASIFAGIAAQRVHLPIFWMVHEILEHPSLVTRLKMCFIRKYASAMAWDSNLGRTLFPSKESTPSMVITNHVDLARFPRTHTIDPDPLACKTIVANGPFPRKGADLFLEAARLITQWVDTPCQFVLLGAEQSQHLAFCTRLHEMANSPDLQGKVVFAGSQKNIPDILKRTDVFVSASRNEAWPIIVIEAMATGVPVVCTDVGDCKIIIGDNNERGILVPPNNANALAHGILDLITKPEETKKKADRACKWVAETCGKTDYIQPLEQLLEQCVATHNP